jgi:transcriptional antiterminator NusG
MTDESNPHVPGNPPANAPEATPTSVAPGSPTPELEATSPRPPQEATRESVALETQPEPTALETTPASAALETTPEPMALETTPEPMALESVPEPKALETIPEPMALETTPEHAALETTPESAPPESATLEAAPAGEDAQTPAEKEVEAPPEPMPRKRKSETTAASRAGRKRKAAQTASPTPTATDSRGAMAPSTLEATSETETAVSPSSSGGNKKWYVIKVASGREESIKTAIERKIKIEGLEQYFGQIVIPYEELVLKKTVKVKDKKTGEMVTQEKKTVKKQKKFPGYLFAELEINDRILYLFRETSGVGDFVGARGARREPTPMTEREVQQILTGVVLPGDRKKLGLRQIVKLDFEKGDKVRIREGAFANMEGEVKAITEAKEEGDTPKVTVQVTVFGRPVDVTLDYWQVDKA